MADKQFARSGTSDFDFSVDDPLAELARIVGYEDKPPVPLRDLEPAKPPVVALRKEPVFDLEDELMQAFENYDAPRFDPFRAVSARMAEQAAAVQPDIAEREELYSAPEPDAIGDLPVDEPVYDEAVAEEYQEPAAVVQADEPVDLEQELEMSIGYADDRDAHWNDRETSVADGPVAYAADAEAGVAEPADEELVAPDEEQPGVEAQASDDDMYEDGNLHVGAAPAAVETHGEAGPARVETRAAWTDIDELLEEVERFPVPLNKSTDVAAKALPLPQASETARKNNYPFTPTFGRATPVVSSAGAATSTAFATPLSQQALRPADVPATGVFAESPSVDLVNVPSEEPASFVEVSTPDLPLPIETAVRAQPGIDVPEPVLLADAGSLEPAMEEPEFDLENFELDLSDIELDVDPAEFEMSSEAAFAEQPAVQDVFDPSEFAIAAEPVSEPLPFDPSMITAADETVHTMAEMNVPQLPVAEKEQAYKPDYDLDIDAEIGQLFAAPTLGSNASSQVEPNVNHDFLADPIWAAASERVERKRRQDEDALDDFERALEEDFRRSLNEPRQQRSLQDESDFIPPSSGEMVYRGDEGRRRLPAGLIALGVVAVLAIGGGVYAFVGGGSTASSDGPQIILADKTPTKMVPVEKGGKTVPNQDKAVYDRVAGNTNVDPSQKALVSSVEEPVDVVQRTLTPETLPLEGAEDDADLTSAVLAGDTDARLLPNGDTANGTQTDAQKPGVSPRKVRTMVVKPDGTLVAREEIVTQPAADTTNVVADNAAQSTTTPVTETAALATGQEAETELRAIAETPADKTVSALAEAADTTVEGTAPVRVVKTTKIGDQAPIPETRPLDQPVNVVGTVTDQGNVSNKVTTTPVADTTVATATADTAANTQVAAVKPGGYVIQIASLPSAADAQSSYGNLSNKFASVIGGRGVDIRKADIPNKGTFFRVRIPAGSREEANALCARYKQAGGSCLVTK